VKKVEGYETSQLGDRAGGLLKTFDTADVGVCAQECNDNVDCIGFSYGKTCELKQGGSDFDTYEIESAQFFEKTGMNLPKAQFVVLTHPEDVPRARVLTPLEIEVYDKYGRNMALGRPVVSSAMHGGDDTGAPKENVTDGDLTTFAHSAHGAVGFFKIDLGSEKEIKEVIVHNMQSDTKYNSLTVSERIETAYVELQDAAGTVVETSPAIDSDKATHIFRFHDDFQPYIKE
jgi:hypothetical protein